MANPGFNISTFRSYLEASGVQRPSKFLVRIPMPVGMLSHPEFSQITDTVRQLEYWADAASLPGMIINSHPNLRYGYGAYDKKPVSPIVEDIGISFIGDGLGAIHHFFLEWMRMIINYDMSKGIKPGSRTGSVSGKNLDPYEVSYKYEYMTDINIVTFNEVNEEIQSIVLREAWPIGIEASQLQWAAVNSLVRLPVIFTCQDWYSTKTNAANKTLTP